MITSLVTPGRVAFVIKLISFVPVQVELSPTTERAGAPARFVALLVIDGLRLEYNVDGLKLVVAPL